MMRGRAADSFGRSLGLAARFDCNANWDKMHNFFQIYYMLYIRTGQYGYIAI